VSPLYDYQLCCLDNFAIEARRISQRWDRVYVKKVRPLDGWLNYAALLPFDEPLPTWDKASPEIIQRVNDLWVDASANEPELGLPVFLGTDPRARYELCRQVREVLGAYVAVMNDPAVKRPKVQNEAVFDSRINDIALPLARRSLGLNGGGAYLSEDPVGIFLNCLLQTDVWNLWSCQTCRAPFLPRRPDQKTCRPKCAKIRRRRLERAARRKGREM